MNSNKEYLEDFTYIEDKENKKVKKDEHKDKNKVKKLKTSNFSIVNIVNFLLRFIMGLLRIIFCFLILLSLSFVSLIKEKEIDLENEIYQEQLVFEENIQTTIDKNIENDKSIYANFISETKAYIEELNAIINGEILIINNLEENLISEKDAYNYFSKTLTKKESMLKDLKNTKFDEELLTIVKLMEQITQKSSNLSKEIMNHYLLGNNSSKMISDMDKFYTTYQEDYKRLIEYLNYLN